MARIDASGIRHPASGIRHPASGILTLSLSHWSVVAAAPFVAAAALAQGADAPPPPIAGIHHYEIVVIGSGIEASGGFAPCDRWNRAYEVTDCGLVVGQLGVFSEPAPDPSQWINCDSFVTRHAFIYSTVARPDLGLAAGELRLLPNPVGSGAVAFDANDHGFIVGAAGAERVTRLQDERALLWRISPAPSGGGVVVAPQVIDPPLASFRSYSQGGFGRLASVSNGLAPTAAGTFRLDQNCPGVAPLPRTGVSAVEFTDFGVAHNVLCLPGNFVEHRAHSVSANGQLMAGFAESPCLFSYPVCVGSERHSTQFWSFSDPNPGCADGRTPDPNVWPEPPEDPDIPFFDSASVIRAVLGNGNPNFDGAGVGTVADTWEANGLGCAEYAAAWWPGSEDDITILPVPGAAFVRSEATDLDRISVAPEDGSPAHDSSCTALAGDDPAPELGTIAVGSGDRPVQIQTPNGFVQEFRQFGAVWHRPDCETSWSASAWTYRDVTAMVSKASPLADTPLNSALRITWIDGVNAHGDMAGQLEIELPVVGGQSETTFLWYPILLRAVKNSRVGDFNRDGIVGASDLAVLLNAWCLQATEGANCSAIADLSLDGLVSGQDLSMLLANWGPAVSPPPPCAAGFDTVPAAIANEAKAAVEFSIEYMGLSNLPAYRQWSRTAPEPLRELVDAAIFELSKELLGTTENEGGQE